MEKPESDDNVIQKVSKVDNPYFLTGDYFIQMYKTQSLYVFYSFIYDLYFA